MSQILIYTDRRNNNWILGQFLSFRAGKLSVSSCCWMEGTVWSNFRGKEVWGGAKKVQHYWGTRSYINLIQREKLLFVIQVQPSELSQMTLRTICMLPGAPPLLKLTYDSLAAWHGKERPWCTPYVKAWLCCWFIVMQFRRLFFLFLLLLFFFEGTKAQRVQLTCGQRFIQGLNSGMKCSQLNVYK